jgi:hypothetical protein
MIQKLGDIEVGITKSGPFGHPRATVFAPGDLPFDTLSAGILKDITRNADLRKKLGLKACLACISGMDIDIRHRFEEVVRVRLG